MQLGLTRILVVRVGLLLGAVSLICFVPSHGFRFEPLTVHDLIRIVERSSDSVRRVAALRGLGSILPRHCGDPATVAAAAAVVMPRLESPLWPVRHEAVYAMHPLCVCANVPCPLAVVERLEDTDPSVRRAAASWLDEMTEFPPGADEIARRCVASEDAYVLMIVPHLLRRTFGETDEVRNLIDLLSRHEDLNVRHNAESATWRLSGDVPRVVAFGLDAIGRYHDPDVWNLPFQERDPFRVRAGGGVMLLEEAATRSPDDTVAALLVEIADPASLRHSAATFFLCCDGKPEERRPLNEALVTHGTVAAVRELTRGNTAGAAAILEAVLQVVQRGHVATETVPDSASPTESAE